ncbi:MAG: membrane-bound lytic murein transglycosylase MltF [Halofilum sp. (in: g-proteobacteria)]|nr:membrane-bound lytic murein transglycosylase MltF [Halofilum sp. (in: g-proteobacteria)]
MRPARCRFPSRRLHVPRGAAWLAAAVALLAGCDFQPANPEQAGTRSLEEIRADGTLVVLTRNAPTTYYIDRLGEPAGPEYDLVQAFADHLGVEVEFRLRDTVGAILEALEAGEGDLAAAGLTYTDARAQRFRFGESYQRVTQQVVCRRDAARVPESVEELAGLDLDVIAASSYVERLEALRADGHPDLEWEARPDATTEQLMREVWRRELDCTVADSSIVDINRRYYPELTAPFNLSRAQPLAWALPHQRADTAEAIEDWLDGYRASDRLAQWAERHYGFFEVFDYVDTRVLMRRIKSRYPRYRELFEAAAKKHGLAPLLLAAQGYQESHWNPRARSPTGVRGIMMLTQTTAREVGVSNRMDPRQSIFGGARYLERMRARLGEEVTEPDRTWLALAAYNVGWGHLRDARELARGLGANPNHWRELRDVLPLLAEPRYYANLRYGYARGTEPVRYVQRIREYRHVLRRALR